MALSDLLELTLLLLLPLLERLSAEDCPCSEASLCRPIRHHRDFEVSIPFARRSDTVGCKRSCALTEQPSSFQISFSVDRNPGRKGRATSWAPEYELLLELMLLPHSTPKASSSHLALNL